MRADNGNNSKLKNKLIEIGKRLGLRNSTGSKKESELTKNYIQQALSIATNDDLFLMSQKFVGESRSQPGVLCEKMTGYTLNSLKNNTLHGKFIAAYTASLDARQKNLNAGLEKIGSNLDFTNEEHLKLILGLLFVRTLGQTYEIQKHNALKKKFNANQSNTLPEYIKTYLNSDLTEKTYNTMTQTHLAQLLNPSPAAAVAGGGASADTSDTQATKRSSSRPAPPPRESENENTTKEARAGGGASAATTSTNDREKQINDADSSAVTEKVAKPSSSSTTTAFIGQDKFFADLPDDESKKSGWLTQRTTWLDDAFQKLNSTSPKTSSSPAVAGGGAAVAISDKKSAAELWGKSASQDGKITFEKKEGDKIDATNHSATIHLTAKSGANNFADITLTRKDETQNDQSVTTWTCDATFKDIKLTEDQKEKMRFQLIAAESLALREAQGLADAKKIGIVELNEVTRGTGTIKPTSEFILNSRSPELNIKFSQKEVDLIQAHLDAGYKPVTYRGLQFTGITPHAIPSVLSTTVTYVTPSAASNSDEPEDETTKRP